MARQRRGVAINERCYYDRAQPLRRLCNELRSFPWKIAYSHVKPSLYLWLIWSTWRSFIITLGSLFWNVWSGDVIRLIKFRITRRLVLLLHRCNVNELAYPSRLSALRFSMFLALITRSGRGWFSLSLNSNVGFKYTSVIYHLFRPRPAVEVIVALSHRSNNIRIMKCVRRTPKSAK